MEEAVTLDYPCPLCGSEMLAGIRLALPDEDSESGVVAVGECKLCPATVPVEALEDFWDDSDDERRGDMHYQLVSWLVATIEDGYGRACKERGVERFVGDGPVDL